MKASKGTLRYVPPGPLGFGGAPLGNMFEPVDEQTASEALTAAWDSGVRHFDTAPSYGSGLGEHRFGQVLRHYPRESFVLSTKVGRLLRAPGSGKASTVSFFGPCAPGSSIFFDGLPFQLAVDYGYDSALRSVEDSMQRLGMSKIDVVYVHDLGPDHLGDAWRAQFDLALDGCFRALREMREQGVIGAWGLGNNTLEPCIRALREADPDIIQISRRYTLLDQTALDELLPLCAERGVGVVCGSPFNSGILAGSDRHDYQPAAPEIVARRERIAAICRRHGVDIRAAALQFCVAHPVVTSVIPGSKHAEKVQENAKWMRTAIPRDVWSEFKAEGLIREDAPVPA